LKKVLKRAKTFKNLKKPVEKFINKKGLFYAKFFEFEEFSTVPFFCSSFQPLHTVDCFGLVIPYANSSKCHQILCNNMFLIPCDKINRNITTHFIPQYLKYGFHVENPPGLLAS
jgi:hypothetical protein